MAITIVGVTSNPADNGSLTNTAAIDKDAGALASAQAGDLIAVWVQYRAAITSDTAIKVNETSGQYWEHLPQGTTGGEARVVTGRWIICRRFSGTWGASDPSFSHMSLDAPSGTAGLTAVAFVIRPTSSTKHWIVERNNRAAPAAAASFTVTGVTPTNASNITIAVAGSVDDNTWTVSGSGWIQTGLSAQYRNTAGSDSSCSLAYQIQTSAAATGNVTFTQATLGNDAGLTSLITFAEIDLPTGGTAGTGALVDSGTGEGQVSEDELTATLDNGPSTAGNTLVALFHFESAAQGWPTTVTDDGGNTYYQLMIQSDTGLDQIGMWYFSPNASAASTVTVTLSAAEISWAVFLYEFNGALAFDGASGTIFRGNDDFTGLNIACPAYTPSVNNCTLVGMAFRSGGGDHDDLIDADGWTLGERAATEADVTHYQVQTSATAEDYDIDSVAPSSGPGAGAANTVTGFIVLKPVAGGGGATGIDPHLKPVTLLAAASRASFH